MIQAIVSRSRPRFGWVAACLALCLAAVPPVRAQLSDCPLPREGPGAGATATHSTGNAALDRKLGGEAKNLAAFFGITPCVFMFDASDSYNAFARVDTYALYVGKDLLQRELQSGTRGELVIACVLAHEFGHLLEDSRHSPFVGQYRENFCDYLAGYYMRRNEYVQSSDAESLAASMCKWGDSIGGMGLTGWRASHGSSKERSSALLAGYRNSFKDLEDCYGAGEGMFLQMQQEKVGGENSSLFLMRWAPGH